MAYLVATGNVPQNSKLRGLQINLINSRTYVNEIDAQLVEMTDAQIEEQFGIPAAQAATFKTQITSIKATLNADAILNIVSRIGFTT